MTVAELAIDDVLSGRLDVSAGPPLFTIFLSPTSPIADGRTRCKFTRMVSLVTPRSAFVIAPQEILVLLWYF